MIIGTPDLSTRLVRRDCMSCESAGVKVDHACSGPNSRWFRESASPAAHGEHTYALFTDRVPAPRRLDRDEALTELALRYFTSHGPATRRDLAYWATLTLTDVRGGIDGAADKLASFEHDGRTFWHAPGDARHLGQEAGPMKQGGLPDPRKKVQR